MFANYLIGLREGLEAALVVAILVAYVVRLDRRDLLPRLWAGVGAAVVLSVVFGAVLTFTNSSLGDEGEELFAGIMSLAAVGLITWMIFWMAKNARFIKGHLHAGVDKALSRGAWALALVAFVAVVREGLETALFLWAGVQSSSTGGLSAVLGALLGLATAAVLGVMVYKGSLRLQLATLFKWTGVALVIIAAGVLRYSVHELQEVGVLPGADNYVVDFSGVVSPDGVVGTSLRAILNITPAMTALEVAAWLAYVAVVLTAFVVVVRRKPAPRPAAPAQATAVAAEA